MAVQTSNAPELTQEQVQRLLVRPLEDTSVILTQGVRIFDTNGSPVRVPKMGTAVDPGWHGESEQISETNPQFDEVLLLPETMKSLKTITRYSNELARQSIVALDAALQSRLVKDVADKMDRAFIAGDGDLDGQSNKTTPIGVLNFPETKEMDAVGVPSLDDLHDAVGIAMGENVEPANLRWMVTSRDFVNLRKIKDGQQRYQLQPDPTAAGKFTLLGHPVTVTNRIPQDGGTGSNESSIVLWDPTQVAVARDLAPSVKVLTERYADFDQQAIRVVCRYDIGALNPEGVVVLRGVSA